MKIFAPILLVFVCLSIHAQTHIEKSIPIRAGQKLTINADDPQITLQTWDKSEVLIKGTVTINDGENDSAFDLQVTTTADRTVINSVIKDRENLPKRITIKKDDKEYFFKTGDMHSPEIEKFMEQNGKNYSYMSTGVIKDIKLEIFIPKNTETTINAKYGMVEVKNFSAPLTIDSKYGGIDASVTTTSTGELTARSQHGEIMTNLDVKFDHSPRGKGDKWTEISAKLGTGPSYSFESKYGNVYLRKPAN